jgi:hypothetical protein
MNFQYQHRLDALFVTNVCRLPTPNCGTLYNPKSEIRDSVSLPQQRKSGSLTNSGIIFKINFLQALLLWSEMTRMYIFQTPLFCSMRTDTNTYVPICIMYMYWYDRKWVEGRFYRHLYIFCHISMRTDTNTTLDEACMQIMHVHVHYLINKHINDGLSDVAFCFTNVGSIIQTIKVWEGFTDTPLSPWQWLFLKLCLR